MRLEQVKADRPPTYITLNQRSSYITLSHGPQPRALTNVGAPEADVLRLVHAIWLQT